MSYKVLYRKYRPDTFDNVVGQEYTVEMLKRAIVSGKNAHAYIFTGPRGTGKTSSAKIFAKALNCLHPVDGSPCGECEACLNFKNSSDIIEIDAASNNGVDEIRELINNVKLVPTSFKYKVYIIDEVHMLTASAFNALLLTLEEPPSHVIFILATTDIQNVPITILSRCQRFDFKPISKQSLMERLRFVAREECIPVTEEAIEEIALISAGGMRDALGMLDQLASEDKKITLDIVSSYFGSVSTQKIDKLLTCIENNSIEELLDILQNIKESGTNYSVFVEKMINELRKCAIELKSGKSKHRFDFSTLYSLVFDLNECLCNININVNPYILIEMVLLKYVETNEKEKTEPLIQNDLRNNQKVLDTNESLGNKVEQIDNLGNNLGEESKDKIDVKLRINNCFVGVAKEFKNKVMAQWQDFLSYVLTKDKVVASLLADTSICAASSMYVILSSKIDSTNELININIRKIEKYYKDFANHEFRFVAVTEKEWKEESLIYKENKKNGKLYTFIDENLENDAILNKGDSLEESNSFFDVAKDIFGTFEVK